MSLTLLSIHMQDHAWLQGKAEAIQAALEYILRHTSAEDTYFETPKFCGATKFALAVTYWKGTL